MSSRIIMSDKEGAVVVVPSETFLNSCFPFSTVYYHQTHLQPMGGSTRLD